MFAADKRLPPLILDWFDAHLRNASTTAAPEAAPSKPTAVEEFWTLLTSPGGLDKAYQLYDVERRRNPKTPLWPPTRRCRRSSAGRCAKASRGRSKS
jgi:hypothetical protein